MIPPGTHLQFLLLDTLVRNPKGISATCIRDVLRAHDEDRKGPKFYQLMRRLKVAGYLVSWSKSYDVAGGTVHRTFYRITPAGSAMWQATIDFYRTCRLSAKRGQLARRLI